MLNSKKLRKTILSTVFISLSLIPANTFAKEQNITETVIKFLPRIQETLIVKDDTNQKFTDDSPSAIYVEPITNVEDYLPKEEYPASIDTKTLLEQIKPRTDTFTVIDIKSGKIFEAMRYGGNKHLDAEPKTKSDAQILNSINGHSWDRRAILLCIDNEYYAASMHTMPHGNGHITSNGYNGHFCIHVLGSKTHGGGKSCELHQEKIQDALNTNIAEVK